MDDDGLFGMVSFKGVFNNIVRNGVEYFLLKSEELVLSCDEYCLLVIQRGLL